MKKPEGLEALDKWLEQLKHKGEERRPLNVAEGHIHGCFRCSRLAQKIMLSEFEKVEQSIEKSTSSNVRMQFFKDNYRDKVIEHRTLFYACPVWPQDARLDMPE